MAKKNTTPRTILDAPKLTPRLVVKHAGLNRAERRHRYVRVRDDLDDIAGKIFKLNGRANISRLHRVPATNMPYRKQNRS